jgi:hypothetical protein
VSKSASYKVLTGEIRRRPLEDLHLKLKPALIPTELDQLFFSALVSRVWLP